MKPIVSSLCALALAGAILAGCGPSQAELDARATGTAAAMFATQTAEAPTPTPRPTPTPTATPTPTPPSPEALLDASNEAVKQAGSYHFEMEAQMKMTVLNTSVDMPMSLVGDFAPPDRTQAEMSFAAGGVEAKTSIITIGETTYATNPATSEWEVTTGWVSPIDPGSLSGAEAADFEDLALIGEETLDGEQVYHLKGVLSAEALGAPSGEFSVDVWIGVVDALPRRVALEGELTIEGGALFGGAETLPVSMTATMAYRDFGKAVEIEAPRIALYRDDFSDPTSGWDEGSDELATLGYDEDGYRILVSSEGTTVWGRPGEDFADVSIEVTAEKVGGPDDNYFGITCRYHDPDNNYSFLISSDGFTGIGGFFDGEWEFLGTGQMEFSRRVNQGDRRNAIRADCIGDTLTLYVNGTEVMSVSDSRHSSGDVGLVAGTFSEPGTDILFDDFAVYEP